MMLQFLTLATLLWLVICTNVIYQKVTKQHRQTVRRVVGEQAGRSNFKRPIIRYYIFGYGVALIVLVLTASINVNFYASQRHCFMKLAPFLGSVIVPAAVLLSLFIGFALSSYCVISTAPSHITEQIEIDAFVGGQNNGGAMSVSTLERPDDERSSKSILRHLTLMFLFFVITWTTAALTVTTKSTFEKVFLLEDLFAIFFGLASSVLSFFVLSTFCVLRRDVRRCWQRPICLSTSRHHQHHQYISPDEYNNDRLLETANLVNPFSTNPTLAGKSSTSFKFPSANFQSNASNHHLQGSSAFAFGHSGQVPAHQYENCQLPVASMHHVSRGTVVAQSMDSTKDKDLNKIDSDDASSDHLSLNNMNHLRRGFVAPVNSGCVSEADYAMLPPPGHLFAPKMLTLGPPHASSPSGSHVPQLINLSPIAPTNNYSMISNPGSLQGISVPARPVVEFPESQQENIYTESCTIKLGQLATKTHPDGPQHLKRAQRPNKPAVVLANGGKTSSASRRHPKTKNNAAKIPLDDDDRLSNGSSTCSNNGGSSTRTHKRPKHRKPKSKNGRRAKYDEPVEIASGSYTKGESSNPFSSEDKLSEPLLSAEDDGCNLDRSSHLIRDLGAAELLKRETSV